MVDGSTSLKLAQILIFLSCQALNIFMGISLQKGQESLKGEVKQTKYRACQYLSLRLIYINKKNNRKPSRKKLTLLSLGCQDISAERQTF
jgi:hypothetical protein